MLLQHDPTTADIFAQPLLISYRRNFLVKSKLKSDHQPGTFKCARVRYRTSPFISNANKISGPKQTVTITDQISCISAHFIYGITVLYLMQKKINQRNGPQIISANTVGMLRLTIKMLPNQTRDISTSPTILKNTWRFVAFLSISVILKAEKT